MIDVFIGHNTAELAWEDEGELQVKVLRRDPDDDSARDVLRRFPAGHVEPRHAHAGEHMELVVEGRVLVGGAELGPGDYVYGPRDEPHGPFEYPEGAVVYAAERGDLRSSYDDLAEPDAPRFVTVRTADIPWSSGTSIVELPEGVQVKVLRHDPGDEDAREMMVRFPPGYVEPRHTHPGEHNNIILEGRMLVHGMSLGPGDYLFGPRFEPHGPMQYPDGIVLCAFHRADPAHDYEGKTKETAA